MKLLKATYLSRTNCSDTTITRKYSPTLLTSWISSTIDNKLPHSIWYHDEPLFHIPTWVFGLCFHDLDKLSVSVILLPHISFICLLILSFSRIVPSLHLQLNRILFPKYYTHVPFLLLFLQSKAFQSSFSHHWSVSSPYAN